MFDALKKEYDKNGYAIVRDVIESELVSEVEDHVHWLSKKYPDTRPEAFHHSLLVYDPFIHHLLDSEKLLNVIGSIIGPDIALFGAHYIAKKPHDGKPVGWHQDGSYWPLEPMEVVSVWIAGTDSTTENACMRVIPGTQNKKMIKPSEMINLDTEEYVLDLAIDPKQIDDSDAVDIELRAGDISIHNPSIVHGSKSNDSDRWRIGLTLRYIPTSTYVNRDGWDCILLRGNPKSGIENSYAEKPVFDPIEHMSFSGQDMYR